MSIPKTTKINCPHCHTFFTTTTWSSVNTDLEKDLATKVANGTFFQVKCPHCGFIARLEYDFLYHDVSNNAMIWVVHQNDPVEYAKKIAEIKNTAKMVPVGVTTRIVNNTNQLREKVAALMSGKDDRIIELCKVYIKYDCIDQNPEFEFKNAFYGFVNGKDIVFIYDVNGKELNCTLDDIVYQTVAEIFSDALQKSAEEPYAIYDSAWAEAFFDQNFPQNLINTLNDDKTSSAATETEELAESTNKDEGQQDDFVSEKMQLLEQIQWLKTNPFFLLKVSPTDTRREITTAADEMSFLLDAEECANAQNVLLNPTKRLSAELDWFIDISQENIMLIRDNINKSLPIATDNLPALSKLNAILYNFSLGQEINRFALGQFILNIDKQYSNIDLANLTDTINQNRTLARMSTVTQQDISFALGEKRTRIRQMINDRLAVLSKSNYLQLINLLAEKYLTQEEYNSGIILFDVMDQYELRMQSEVDERTRDIEAHIERIKQVQDNAACDSMIRALIKKVQYWDKLVQPLQLKSQVSGMPHQTSEHLGHELRELAIYLHNEKRQTEVALILVNAMRDVFAELADLANIFETDSGTLNNFLNNDKKLKELEPEIEALRALAARIKEVVTFNNVSKFISKVKELNAKIQGLDISPELKNSLRESICLLGRDVAVSINNEKGEKEDALRIAQMLLAEFGDIADLSNKLKEDVNTLDQMLASAKAARKTIWKIFGVIVAIIVSIVIISDITDSGSSTSYSPPSADTVIDDVPSAVSYSSSLSAGTEVYVDIDYIFPAIGIYMQGSTSYYEFVCECRTSSGETVWLHMSVADYRTYFDADASNSIYEEYAEEIFLSTTQVRGTVKRAESVLTGLSTEIGTTKLIEFSHINYLT